ncbi:uncharacterized protein (DUF302 family) [Paraburkholderia sp. BL10I2N1]|nr:uncharacterized protein (DUF302 family) [Paraburkholderia sp. BL10I2N1]
MVPAVTHAETTSTLPGSVTTIQSRYDFQTTVSRLKENLAAHGVTLFADIDQSSAAVQAGTTLRPTRLFLFGNPKAGTPIMQRNPHAALQLPLRAVIWEDDQHGVHVDYQDVTQELANGYGIAANLYAPLKQVPTILRAVAGQE